MNTSRNFIRCVSRSVPRALPEKPQVHPGYIKIRDKYRHFQVENGLLVHQRGGITDNVLFGLTILVNGVGLIMVGEFLYKSAFGIKQS